MVSIRTNLIRPVAARGVVVAGGLVVGVGLSSFRLLWPWFIAVAVAAVWLALKRRHPLLLWLALGVAAGGIAYIALGLALAPFDEPSSGAGGA
ncbi:MAG: hypothetical protein ACREXY_10950 [Gammaproteobacteria bacterium]